MDQNSRKGSQQLYQRIKSENSVTSMMQMPLQTTGGVQVQRPPRSFRQSKTSQGARPRHGKNLLPSANYHEIDDGGLGQIDEDRRAYQTENLAVSDPYAYATDGGTYSMPQTSQNANNNLLPFQQRTFNGLLNDVVKRPRRATKNRKGSGKVTLFQQVKNQGSVGGNQLMARDRSSRKLKRSTMSNRSRSSSQSKKSAGWDGRCSTPDSQRGRNHAEKLRRSLNEGRRERQRGAISAENMRFVARLVNVKATVPSGQDVQRRDSRQKQLRKNLANSSFASANYPALQVGKPMAGVGAGSRQGSRLGTPMSSHSEKRVKASPKVDMRLKSKALNNFRMITRSPEQKSSTPEYLKPRKLDQKQLAQMYEADDHLLFGTRVKRSAKRQVHRGSDTASQRSHASSQRSSIQGSKRRKKKIRRRFLAEAGSDTPYNQLGENFDPSKAKKNTNTMEIKSSHIRGMSGINRGLAQEPIEEHPGPKPQPAGQSLIQKMNNLMTQKQSSELPSTGKRPKNYAKSNAAEQVQHSIPADQEIYTQYTQQELNSTKQSNEIMTKNQQKKAFVLKMSRSIPRNHNKRKSLQDHSFAAQPFNMPTNHHQKAALLSGYYTSQQVNPQRSSSKPTKKVNGKNAGSLPPRNIKTATIRRPAKVASEQVSLDYMPLSSYKASPGSSYKPTRTLNGPSQQSSKRRIIVAVNKENDGMEQARHTDSGWNRRRQNLTTVEGQPMPAQGKPRPGVPLSAHPTTAAAARHTAALKPPRQTGPTGGQQPVRAYQDGRKKFLTDKLFSPVLQSQLSQSATGQQNNKDIEDVDPQRVPDSVFADGLRPRQTRTADGSTRARIQGSKISSTGFGTDYRDEDQHDLLPSIVQDPILVTSGKWLASGSGTGEASHQTLQNHTVAPISGVDPQRLSFNNDKSAPFVGKVGTQLNMESQDTFNQVTSHHNIREDAISPASDPFLMAAASSKILFNAPSNFNQISEEGGDGMSDSGSKNDQLGETRKLNTGAINNNIEVEDGSEDEANDSEREETEKAPGSDTALPQSYPRLI